jgi:hypothetical protein
MTNLLEIVENLFMVVAVAMKTDLGPDQNVL